MINGVYNIFIVVPSYNISYITISLLYIHIYIAGYIYIYQYTNMHINSFCSIE